MPSMAPLTARCVRAAALAGRRAHEDERGQALPLLIGAMMLFVVFGVLVMDFGIMLAERREAQRAVDLAALAAAQELPGRAGDPDTALKLANAEDMAGDYLVANGFDGTGGASTGVSTSYDGDPAKIEVTAGRSVPWLFGGFFGLVAQEVSARAVASANAQPRDVILVLDRSGSMCQDTHGGPLLTCPGSGPWEPFDTMRDASLDFGTVLVPLAQGETLDRLSLVTYSTTADIELQLTNNYDAGSPYETAVGQMHPEGYTNVGYGLTRARQELAARGRPDASHVIVLLSDGYANRYRSGGSASNPTFTTCGNFVTCAAADSYAREQAIEAAEAGASIYTIGYT
ncbi:MAG: VWA domain-containing protein, partial [Dehalococcoidia bacterium]